MTRETFTKGELTLLTVKSVKPIKEEELLNKIAKKKVVFKPNKSRNLVLIEFLEEDTSFEISRMITDVNRGNFTNVVVKNINRKLKGKQFSYDGRKIHGLREAIEKICG